ncbi:hypothetical protein ANN_09722 [Periplaneta americana]|uniref:Mutator-like transposase domain-containing protein n=1 Tax=Periplaneta americana TaxID=6978 RepID=A0ABQ8TM30_PERAM|nr:hypothetical protein ANN_09722 [Periplaneta americana]
MAGLCEGNNEPAGSLKAILSYAGTWTKRGFTGSFGVGCVIDVLIGLVIDYEVLSMYCHDCAISEKQIGKGNPEFQFYHEDHKINYAKNYYGSPPGMEVETASRLWKRSESNDFRYNTVLSDSDSKTYMHLQHINVYGNQFLITKEECVNHIAKRLGIGLRNLVKEWKGEKIHLGINKRRVQRCIKQRVQSSLDVEIKRRHTTRVSEIIREDAEKKEKVDADVIVVDVDVVIVVMVVLVILWPVQNVRQETGFAQTRIVYNNIVSLAASCNETISRIPDILKTGGIRPQWNQIFTLYDTDGDEASCLLCETLPRHLEKRTKEDTSEVLCGKCGIVWVRNIDIKTK